MSFILNFTGLPSYSPVIVSSFIGVVESDLPVSKKRIRLLIWSLIFFFSSLVSACSYLALRSCRTLSLWLILPIAPSAAADKANPPKNLLSLPSFTVSFSFFSSYFTISVVTIFPKTSLHKFSKVNLKSGSLFV